MTGPNPVVAHTGPGVVVLVLDVATARSLADAVEFTYASGWLADMNRPRYLEDVATIKRAAATAAAAAGDLPIAMTPVPLLRVVGGASA